MKLHLPIIMLVSLLGCMANTSYADSSTSTSNSGGTVDLSAYSTQEKISYYQTKLADLKETRSATVAHFESEMAPIKDELKTIQNILNQSSTSGGPEVDVTLPKADVDVIVSRVEGEFEGGLESRLENPNTEKETTDSGSRGAGGLQAGEIGQLGTVFSIEDRKADLEDQLKVLEDEYAKVLSLEDEEIAEYEAEIEKLQYELDHPDVPTPLPTSSTVNAPGTAQRDALRNQMFAMRDRVANLGRTQAAPTPQQEYWVQPSKDGSVPGHFVKSSSPASASDVQYHLWVEGNGGYTDLNEQSGRGGYRLQTWGGTVGAAASLENNLTLGAAFSAQWGDLTSSGGQEWASGDLDSLYLHLFGHYQSNAWGHTLILTGTSTDATLNRSGFIDGDYFNTHGDTDGYGFGALYELTYDIPLNDAGTTLLQPLFDASIVHTQLDAYDETGTKALHVGKQEWTTGSVALGARLSGTFGSESLGHPFFGEVRASVSQDFGDTRGKNTIAWADQPGVSNTAYGSKVGATAVQVGAGLSTPLTSWSSLYANVGADFRDRENSVGGALGVKFSF